MSSPDSEDQGASSEQPRTNQFSLGPTETWWRDHQQWLQDHGYMLRPRYRPGWKASWEGKKSALARLSCEDAIILRVSYHLVQHVWVIDLYSFSTRGS